MLRLLPLALCLALVGCPKKAPLNVTGSDDDLLDQYSAQLEELRVRGQSEGLTCGVSREIATKACELSRSTCQVGQRLKDRPDVEKKCVAAQEDCAQFNDRAAHCS